MNTDKEVIIYVGYPSAGKSTHVKKYIDEGYFRLNRDELGCSLNEIAEKLEILIGNGRKKIVIDNTYGTIKSRKQVLEVANKYEYPVKCVWLKTGIEDAQVNSATRIIEKFHRLLPPEEIKRYNNPEALSVTAIFTFRKYFEKPTIDEGFSQIEEVKFIRNKKPEYINKAIILDYDGTLRVSTGENPYPVRSSDIKILPNRSDILKKYRDLGYILLGISNQSGIEKGLFSKTTADELFRETNKKLDVDIDFEYCPHHSFPVECYCRKPQPGLGVHFIEKYKLDPSQCIMIGDQTSDQTFAKRCGFKYIHPDEFFGNVIELDDDNMQLKKSMDFFNREGLF